MKSICGIDNQHPGFQTRLRSQWLHVGGTKGLIALHRLLRNREKRLLLDGILVMQGFPVIFVIILDPNKMSKCSATVKVAVLSDF